MERRHATRAHYKHSAEKEYLMATACTFLVGAALGATIAMGLLL